jgi:CRISPR-associated protein Cas1
MAWRGVHLTKPARLSFADGQMVVAQDDGEVRLPLEDIAWIILDGAHATLTSTLLSACMDSGIVVIATDEKHTPNGLALPFHGHFRQGEVAHRQIGMSEPLKKRLWQAIVQAKIANQAASLQAADADAAATLREMTRHVGSGDPENVEARAARFYWSRFFADFRREDAGDRRNALLNYGYAVLRAGIARVLVAYGLLPAFGIHHASVSNAFNLADDLIEPFRPFADAVARRRMEADARNPGDLTADDRRAMASVLLEETRFDGETVTLLTAAERCAMSLVRAVETGTPRALRLPALGAG